MFYQLVAPQLLRHTRSAVPRPLHLDLQPPGSFTFVLSDLRQGFPQQQHGYRLEEAQVGQRPEGAAPGAGAAAPAAGAAAAAAVHACSPLPADEPAARAAAAAPPCCDPPPPQAALDWLAGLHAHFWEQELPEGLWDVGCYWHLATRQEELQQIGEPRPGRRPGRP